MLKAIDEIYEALVAYDMSYQKYTSPWGDVRTPERASCREEVFKNLERFLTVFFKRGIFLPKPIADEISTLADQLHSVCIDFQIHLEMPKGHSGLDGWHKVTEGQKKVPDIKRRLEERCRAILKTDESTISKEVSTDLQVSP